MQYKLRKGIVIESICGKSFVIATIEARKHCPYVMELNGASKFIFEELAQNKTIAQMAELASQKFEITLDNALQVIESFMKQLIAQNYVIVEEDI
ncbi:MAG: PqqD family protein [Bacillota bacterium]|nr:PqqD family protein [Bacillota bacterium]